MTLPVGSPFDLTGHVALVTGGNSGIGLGMAEAMAAHGAAIAIWGTNEAKNAAAKEKLEAYGRPVAAFRCDVGDKAQVDEAFAATVAALGKVDSCHANAGHGGAARSFVEMTDDEWHRVLRTNLDGVFYTWQAAVGHMVERGEGGSLTVTSSIASVSGQPRGQHYGAAKAGVISMMKAIAVEYARHGIRANAIVPGWIDTPLTEQGFAHPKMHERVLTRIPVRRWGTGADFGGIAVYLASSAASYHTGDTFTIDGGYLIY
jgi:NAD(P)-dependent dehydrogenase (short-subunit alcohol dehydrogenase family)